MSKRVLKLISRSENSRISGNKIYNNLVFKAL